MKQVAALIGTRPLYVGTPGIPTIVVFVHGVSFGSLIKQKFVKNSFKFQL